MQRSAQQPLQTTADAANKQLQPQQQLKPPSHLEVGKSKSPQLITNQRSPGPSQSNPVAVGQKQVSTQNVSTTQSQGFGVGNVGPQGGATHSQSGGASIATVVEVGTSQFKSAGGGSFCVANLDLHLYAMIVVYVYSCAELIHLK